MSETGNALLFALSAWRKWRWQAFKTAFDEIEPKQKQVTRVGASPATFDRWRCASLLDALGHCDFTFSDGSGWLVIAPPVLVALPLPGLSRAVLCGARSPETASALAGYAESFKGAVKVSVSSQQAIRYYAPARVEIEAEDADDMARFAEAAGVAFARVPAAWSIVLLAGGLDGYLARLSWSRDPEIGWQRQDFDPKSIMFGLPGTSDARLSRYQDPIRGTWVYRLVREGESAPVDPSWGRFAVLDWNGKGILNYDPGRGCLRVPATSPLPRLIARALVLCSGRAPELVTDPLWEPGSQRGSGYAPRYVERYEGVPADVYEVVTSKLHQPGYKAGGDRSADE